MAEGTGLMPCVEPPGVIYYNLPQAACGCARQSTLSSYTQYTRAKHQAEMAYDAAYHAYRTGKATSGMDQTEIGLQMAVGARPASVTAQIVGESLLLAALGGYLGIGLAWLALAG